MQSCRRADADDVDIRSQQIAIVDESLYTGRDSVESGRLQFRHTCDTYSVLGVRIHVEAAGVSEADNSRVHLYYDIANGEGMAIMTVRGPIEAAMAGYTLSHEHLLCDLWPIVRSYDGILDDEGLAARELIAYREAGGRTLVDVTSGGLGRNPLALRRISEAAGVNVVMGAAWYREDVYPRCVYEFDSTALADVIVNELTTGVDGTDVVAGIIGEIGTERKFITPGAGARIPGIRPRATPHGSEHHHPHHALRRAGS